MQDVVAIRRVYFSPLSKFPGPTIAALTTWYAAYHDIVRGGQYTFVIEEMHRRYGPVVRVMPDVLHVNDPAFVDQLYAPQSSSHRRDKAWTVLNFFQTHYASISTGPHDLHRPRRAAMGRFFSQQNVRRLAPVIDETLADLLRRFEGFAQTETPFVINPALQAATKDVIQNYALGKGVKCLDQEDFNAAFFRVSKPERLAYAGVHFHAVLGILNSMPASLFKRLSPQLASFIMFLEGLAAEIEDIKKSKDDPERNTIFHEIIRSDVSDFEKSTPRLVDEAMVITIAGADTTASVLTALICRVLHDRPIFDRLRRELDSAMPDPTQPPDPIKLDALPYLNALIEECLRLYASATHRQDRVAPDEDLIFQYADGSGTAVIPRGTSVGMTARMLNRHSAWFGDDADEFRPERYLENPALLRRSLTFSKGGRQCIGMNLAYQELQTFTAGLFRRYGVYDPQVEEQGGPTLELFETTLDDVRIHADYVTPGAPPRSRGVCVQRHDSPHDAHEHGQETHRVGRSGRLKSKSKHKRRTSSSASSVTSSSSDNGSLNLKDKAIRKAKTIKHKAVAKLPGGLDRTPLPDAPPGFTVKFIFHRAEHLPVADLSTWSSDPFVHATLKTPLVTRHEEDPDLTWRSRTIRRTTKPVWEEEWIVANVPASGFTLKCRIYDEDYPDSDDRLGNVTIEVDGISEDWEGVPPPGREYKVRKRSAHKGVYLVRALYSGHDHYTPSLWVSMQVLGVSPPPHAQIYTVGPSMSIKHFSPTIGLLTGTRVNVNADDDYEYADVEEGCHHVKHAQRYDFQSSEMQLAGPVPPELYHRYVEFRHIIGSMFTSKGLRGRILSRALHKQHRRVYRHKVTSEIKTLTPCTVEASTELLRLAHYGDGGRIFTYVLTLDGRFRFTETGKEFSIDLLSKHTMHSDVARYVACAGEFFIQRLERPHTPSSTFSSSSGAGGIPAADDDRGRARFANLAISGNFREHLDATPSNSPSYYQLIIDNESGTYRPDKSILPIFAAYLRQNFPGLNIRTMAVGDEELARLKKNQADVKHNRPGGVRIVRMRSPSSSGSSFSS
ncbi:hypothetical protein ACHAPN_006606 [Verticillium nonalfalfae]